MKKYPLCEEISLVESTPGVKLRKTSLGMEQNTVNLGYNELYGTINIC